MAEEYKYPNNYPSSSSGDYSNTINKAELVVKNFANDYVKPLLYKRALGDTSGYLGRQILTDVKLVVKDYQEEVFNINTQKYDKVTVSGAEIRLDTVLVEISSSKNIIKTSINGMKGTVKEYISMGDYQITISGALVSAGKGYPFEQVQTLQSILKAPVAIEIHSELLSLFSVFTIVVESDAFPSREGYTNTQLFSFTATSDEPLELKL